eukprot:1034100-Rhodomonas_salina.4
MEVLAAGVVEKGGHSQHREPLTYDPVSNTQKGCQFPGLTLGGGWGLVVLISPRLCRPICMGALVGHCSAVSTVHYRAVCRSRMPD